MKRETREEARKLRNEGLSISEITKILKVSRGSVSNWTRDIHLTSSQKQKLKNQQKRWGAQNKGAQVNSAKARQKRLDYQKQGREQAKVGSRLHLIGCMLYWAEGSKIKKNSVHFANSDPQMIGLFMRFLREEFDIPEEKYRLQLHCHTHNLEEHKRITQYWTDLLKLSTDSVQKIQVKKGSNTRKNRLLNGICTLQVHSTEIVQHIYGAIQEYGDFENPDWLLVS